MDRKEQWVRTLTHAAEDPRVDHLGHGLVELLHLVLARCLVTPATEQVLCRGMEGQGHTMGWPSMRIGCIGLKEANHHQKNPPPIPFLILSIIAEREDVYVYLRQTQTHAYRQHNHRETQPERDKVTSPVAHLDAAHLFDHLRELAVLGEQILHFALRRTWPRVAAG